MMVLRPNTKMVRNVLSGINRISNRRLLPLILLITTTFILFAMQGCNWEANEDEDDSSISGVIADEMGKPLAGVRVTVAGQEADDLTDEKGQWQISNLETSIQPESPVTASLSGYEIFVSNISAMDKSPSALPTLDVAMQTDFIYIESPHNNAYFKIPNSCQNPEVEVKGKLGGPYDVVILLDISASMQEELPGFAGLRPIDIARDALIEVVEQYDLEDNQIGLVAFFGSAEIRSPLTSDPDELLLALEGLEVFDQGTTNYELGVKSAVDVLVASGRSEADKLIVMISDGIPTANGYPQTDLDADTIAQDQEDINGALEGAFYAQQNDVRVFSVAIGDEASTSKLTTLPAVADITGGAYLVLPDYLDMMELPEDLILHGIDLFEVSDQYGNVYEIPVDPDGSFSTMIPVAERRYMLTFTAYRGEGENQHAYAEKVQTMMISRRMGEMGKVFCD